MDDGGATTTAEPVPVPAPARWTAGRVLTVLLCVLVGLAALVTLSVASLPGSMVFVLPPLALVWLASAGLWIALVVHDVQRRRPSAATLVVPWVVVATAALSFTDMALQVRFDLTRGAFEDAVATMPAGEDYIDDRGLVGTYMIRSMERVDGGVIMAEEIGDSIIDDAGFAYLPAGPTSDLENGSFERPQWHDLGGGWWSWTASW